MNTSCRRWLRLAAVFTSAYCLVGASPMKAQGDCRAVFEADNKTSTQATHIYSTINRRGKDVTTEMIFFSGVFYSRINSGKWTSVPMAPQELMELRRPPARYSGKATCQYLRDELVNGEMASLYSVRDVTPQHVADIQVWISKAKGWALRQELDVDSGAAAKSHHSSRYEYGDVKPPM